MGKFVAEHGESPWAFSTTGFQIRKPEDLKDIPISVGMRAGSISTCRSLEKYLPLASRP